MREIVDVVVSMERVPVMYNDDLVRLARAGVLYVIKATENAAVGRVPEEREAKPNNAPQVPPEIPEASPKEERDPVDIIADAIAVLQEGLTDNEEAQQNPEMAEVIAENVGNEGEMLPTEEADEFEQEEMEEDAEEEAAIDMEDDIEDELKLNTSKRSEISSAIKYMQKSEDTRVSVKAIIKDKNGRTLVLRDAGTSYWDLPGGHVQDGEKYLDALHREISEETGLTLGDCSEREARMLKLGDTVRPVMFYDAEYVGGQPRMSEEHVGYQWAGHEDLNGLNLGVFKDILIPGPDTRGVLEVGDPASSRKSVGPTQIPHYQVKDGGGAGDGGATGIAAAGSPMSSEDSYTPAIGGGKRKKVSKDNALGQLKDIVGTNAFMKGLEALEAIKSAIRKNVALIGTLDDDDKRSLVHDIFALYLEHQESDGQAFNPVDLQRILLKEYDVVPADAKLIAHDQENKLMGAVMEKWQTQAGIEEYVWQTKLDDKVRATHKANQGLKFSWSSPPVTGHPGEDINCRCIALPVLRRRLTKGYTVEDLTFPFANVSTGGGEFVTGEETEYEAPAKRKEQRVVENEISMERKASHLDSAMGLKGVKLQKMIDSARLATTNLKVLSKARSGKPFIIAGYASPVVVDQEGHKITHEALAKDLPRFLGADGSYANVNILHSNLTVGRVLPEWTDEKSGKTYKTMVDDIGLYAVAEIRTDVDAPEAVTEVIKDIKRGKLKSFSISGNAENPVFMCDERQCFYGIDKVNLFEITVCEEGVNQDAKFKIVSE